MNKTDLQILKQKVEAIENFYLKPPYVGYASEGYEHRWFHIKSQENANLIHDYYYELDNNFDLNSDFFSEFQFTSSVWICLRYDNDSDNYIFDEVATSFIDEAQEFLKAFSL
jgi:hypothetical protein